MDRKHTLIATYIDRYHLAFNFILIYILCNSTKTVIAFKNDNLFDFLRFKDIHTQILFNSYLLVSSADNICKQFGLRSGPTNVGLDLDPKCLKL